MFVKIQLKDVNKKMKITGVKTYEEFTAVVKATFTNLPEGSSFYYYDSDNERIDVNSQNDFEGYLHEDKKPKIIVKLPDEDYMNQSFFEKSKSNEPQAIQKETSEEFILPPEKKTDTSFKKGSKLEQRAKKNASGSQVPKLLGKKSSKVQQGNEAKAKKESSIVEKKEEKVNKTVHKNIKCNHCKSEIVGIRWKCLDEFDMDVCNNCYEAKIHKAGHSLLKIDTEDYLSKINYRDSIYRLFNPKYEEIATDQSVKAWIKEEDLLQSTPQAVKQIWNASAELAKTVASEFDDWEKEWQRKGIKS